MAEVIQPWKCYQGCRGERIAPWTRTNRWRVEVKQEWYCEACRVLGAVTLPKHLDAWGGLHQVIDDHTRRSPNCKDASKIRVRAPHGPAFALKIRAGLGAVRRQIRMNKLSVEKVASNSEVG